MRLKNHIRNKEVQNWQRSEAIAKQLYDKGEPLTVIFKYLTTQADLNREQALVIIKNITTNENVPDLNRNNEPSGGLSDPPQ